MKDRDVDLICSAGATMCADRDFHERVATSVADNAPHWQSQDPYLCHAWTPQEATGSHGLFDENQSHSAGKHRKTRKKSAWRWRMASVAIRHKHGGTITNHSTDPRLGSDNLHRTVWPMCWLCHPETPLSMPALALGSSGACLH